MLIINLFTQGEAPVTHATDGVTRTEEGGT